MRKKLEVVKKRDAKRSKFGWKALRPEHTNWR